MRFIFLFLILVISACSFKSTDEEVEGQEVRNVSNLNLATIDSDGDMINDQMEITAGKNPHVANLPELKIRFLQNYKIDTSWRSLEGEEEGTFTIDTRVGQDDPDFKYRVGRIFIRDLSLSKAANVAKYANHSWGEIEEHDLSWVKYPKIDPRFYSSLILDYKKYFDDSQYEISNISISLENSVRLKKDGQFKEIKDLELNFYYYNSETENYELIKTALIERHFTAGINEVFEVEIENVPSTLLAENYFKNGQFIISEVKDFFITGLNVKYSELLKSVKNSSLSVIYNTPLETKHSFVSSRNGKARFVDIANDLFGKSFTVLEDKVSKIGEFENNLPEFSYLKEIAQEDKKGRWYILTNDMNQHFLDHEYKNTDVLSLSYITGTELAKQVDETINSYRRDIDGGADFTIYPLGNISPNSKIDIQIKPIRRWGEDLVTHPVEYHERPSSCGTNCVSGRLTVDCYMKNYIFKSYDHTFSFDNALKNKEIHRMKLIINDEIFPLQELIKNKLVKATATNGYLHITIDNITAIKEIAEFEENLLELRLETFIKRSSNGFRLESIAGPHKGVCPEMLANFAHKNKLPIATDSFDFAKWRRFLRAGYFSFLSPKNYHQYFTIDMTSSVRNFFN